MLKVLGLGQVVGWLLIAFAQNVYYLYCMRFLMGYVAGTLFVVVPVFVSEIAHDRFVDRQIGKSEINWGSSESSLFIQQCSRFVGLHDDA